MHFIKFPLKKSKLLVEWENAIRKMTVKEINRKAASSATFNGPLPCQATVSGVLDYTSGPGMPLLPVPDITATHQYDYPHSLTVSHPAK